MEYLLEPLSYQYMLNAIFASAIVGAVCAFLSAFLMLKGWSLIGDALSHSVVPGVAGAYALGLPYAVGAFFSGFLASISIAALKSLSHLKEDAIIGFIFTTFFAAGLLLISLNPTSINVQSIIFGNILSIGPEDLYQIVIISVVSLIVLGVLWKDLMLVFFDETQASAVGLSPVKLKILFFTLLSACTVASLQTVGAVLVIAMVITPGATAYLLTDRFGWLLVIATSIGLLSSGLGAYISYFLDGTTGGIIVLIQTVLFLLAFLFAPKYGLFSDRVAALNRLGNASKVARDA
ncbi:metal ABC transporter permease [Vibrio nigripulchritudo]|uniref:metal ABC transporter permease n=1 Tax=Vibrio nigripulchritudo TaxID=28173 RepID=UPI0023AA1F89|nr:metal ABC transporter permease [Vibrio nigripulchritudo]